MQDHIDGSVPIVISSQGSNLNPSTEPGAANIQADVQTTMDTAKRKVFVLLFGQFFLSILSCSPYALVLHHFREEGPQRKMEHLL